MDKFSQVRRVLIYEFGVSIFLASVYFLMRYANVTGAGPYALWMFLALQAFILGPVLVHGIHSRRRRNKGE
jgi:hypothetical protein